VPDRAQVLDMIAAGDAVRAQKAMRELIRPARSDTPIPKRAKKHRVRTTYASA
jgi:DNA-binding FadR family transcriptional regulator